MMNRRSCLLHLVWHGLVGDVKESTSLFEKCRGFSGWLLAGLLGLVLYMGSMKPFLFVPFSLAIAVQEHCNK